MNAWGLQKTSKSVRVACCDMTLHGEEKTHYLKLLPQEEKRVEMYPASQLFKGLPEGMIFISPN